MSEPRKRPGWVFWTTVVLFVVLVAYPLSFGPVFAVGYRRMVKRDTPPTGFDMALGYYCAPVIWAGGNEHCPECVRHAIEKYAAFWIR